ncbi:hypothetical protein HHK36_014538 [Tetracentron sinense]|uniref:Ribosome-recycling factor, chloroplastic n=1 Tax=Tetracentron sinense TaxID=13715 RepID=A0A835DCT0_TETSI|nr:hypothetical protein HHK36_014538 [Tetracentron sinense]
MAISLRRVFSARDLLLLRSSCHSRNLSYIFSSKIYNSVSETPLSVTHEVSNQLGIDFLRESRRGFAKGRKSKDDAAANTIEVMPDIGPTVKAAALSQMEAATVALSQELSKLRTGRASAGMLDHIIVETSGVKMPLIRVAVVSVLDSKTLSVTPYDPNALKELEHAIVSSPLGLNPTVEGQRLIAVIPPLTKEHIQGICKVVTKSCEDVKQSIRRARQKMSEELIISYCTAIFNTSSVYGSKNKQTVIWVLQALDTVKKAGSSIPKDDAKRLEKEVDEVTKKFVKSAGDMCKAKEKEIAEG